MPASLPFVGPRFITALAVAILVSCSPLGWAKIGLPLQSPLGNPDTSVTDPASRTKYLIQRAQYHLSYNDDTHQANWVSWSYSSADTGSQARTDAWAVEELLPSGYLRIGTSTFGTHFGIQWDRGHITPSADRTTNFQDNAATFRMSNIIPQASKNNQGLWATFESYCRSLATNGNEVLIISGPSEFTGNIIPNSMRLPGSVWKIAVVVPNATSTTPASQRISTASRVIALLTPNVSEGLGTWQSYITSVEEIEELTGLNFFTAVDPSTAIYLKNVVDTGTAPNNPTVVTTFNPTLGTPGTSVTISGYNFNADSSVQFNGVEASVVTVLSPNQLVATVPAGAATGPITADGPGGFDTSYEDFTVSTGSTTPTLSVTPTSVSGLTATQGSAGAASVYGVNGTNLTASIAVTAPTNFEISADGANFASSLTLTPGINGSLGTQVSVRIKANAPAGNVSGSISHASSGLTTQNVAVSGTVTSTSPQITFSTSGLTGFTALQGSAGPSKSYTVSGANLTGSITITAPAGYEVSLDNNTFAVSRTLSPVNGSISTTVHARLSASALLGSNTGLIAHSGGSASTQNVSVAGMVTAPGAGESWIATSGTNTKGSINTGQSFAGKSGVWINEFHYDTVSTDVGEFVEIVVGPEVTTALTNIVLVLYNGGGGNTYGTHALSTFTLGSTVDGYRIFHKDIASLQNGAPDGFAVTVNGGVVQFLSYEGTFIAVDGAAAGLTSADIGIAETAAPVGSSLQLTGSVGSTTPAPVITVSGPAAATALQAFSYQITASHSPDSYAASGLPDGLTINATTGLISGTPTTPGTYTVGLTASNEGGDGTATLTINVQSNPNAPSITSDLIANGQINTAFSYQITAAKSPTSYTAGNLPAGLTINTSTGLISGTPTTGGTFAATITALNDSGSDVKTLQIIIRNPTLTLTPSTLQPFTAAAGFSSGQQSYTLSGLQLTTSITVRAPQHFEISADGSPFTGEIAFNPVGDGTLSKTIVVRLASSAPPGLFNGSISHLGSGATPKYLEVNGTVSTTDPTLTVSTASLEPFTTAAGVASSIQTYEVSGASLTGNITITAPSGFEVGADEESFGEAVIMTPVNGALSATAIYVRLRNDAAVGSYSGNITHTGGGAVSRNVAVSGTVTTPVGPNIIATSGGSAYLSTSYSYTVQTDGEQTVNLYGATGLPTGVNINTSTGVISGTPTVAGTYNMTLSARSSQGTSTKPYTLRVITASEQPTTPTVVINKYHNAATDRVELLVAGDNVDGPPVDLRGMTIKDFNGNMATDGGGKYVFADHPLWSKVKAGTLIVLAAGNTTAEDVDPADFVLRVNLANATYFTQESGGFDIGNTDMLMIKPAGMQPDGVAGGMHALAAGTIGTQYNTYSGRKTRARRDLSGRRGYFCIVVNGNRALADYYLTEGGDVSTSEPFGSGNNSNNTTFINTLRNQDQDGPVITVLGDNPVNISRDSVYPEAGATAFDAGDNASKTITTTGSVDNSTVGTYTLTYTATDSKGNIGTATRTVNVLTPASAPPSVGSVTATSIVAASATLNGNVDNAGTSAVSARGFVYSTMSMTLEIGADGVTTLSGGSGTGSFSVPAENLAPGTTYYFRAFATNETGTSYGETLSFTTFKAEPLLHPANFATGSITSSRIAATWATADADGYLLVVSSGAGSPPTDGVPVADDTDLSDGTGAINLAAGTTSYNGFAGFAPGQSYTFRLYAFNNSGSAIDYKTGSAPTFTAGILTTPELSVSAAPSPLTTTYGTPSNATTFTVSGVYLTSTVSITAPTGFEVSADNASYASAATLTPEFGTLPATTVYLRLAATAGVAGTHNAQTINVSGGGAPPVTLTTAATGHNVATKALNVTGLSAADRHYNGNTAVTIVGSPAYEGLVNNESFPVSGNVTWAFADKNIGAGKVLARTGSFTAPSANYAIATQPSLTASITAKPLTVTGASVTTKIYDTTTAATITGATLVGLVDGDTVAVSGGGTFNNANAGENKPVTASLTLGGAGAGNYTLSQPSLTGTITKADQTITFDALPPKFANDAPFTLSGTSSAGLTVTYTSSNGTVATVSGSTVTLLAAGTTTITASQAGNTNYNAAAPVGQTLTVIGAQYTVAAWDFQTTTNGGTALAAAPNTPKVFSANFGSGTIYLDGSNGSSSWFVGSSGTEINGFGGSTVNTTGDMATTTSGAAALALLGGASNAANGKHIVFAFSMATRAKLTVTYSSQRTSTGFDSQQWTYSTDGINWIPLATLNATTITSSFGATGVITLPTITGLDNSTTAYLRLTVTGATSSSGNNRLDNIQLVASDYDVPDTTAPVITVLGGNPLSLPVGSAFTDPGATALDETDGAVEVSTSGEVNTAVPGAYTITYSATDAANNTATATRTVNVVDVTEPVITVTGDNPLYLPVGATFVEPGVNALDVIDGEVTVQTSGMVDTATRGSYTLTYTASDAAGNEATATRSVVVRAAATHVLETQYGLDGLQAGLTADADQDGVPNLMEYAFGSNPAARNSTPTPNELQKGTDTVQFSAVVRSGDPSLSITPLINSNLTTTWSAAGLTEVENVNQHDVPAGFLRRTWQLATPNPDTQFIRFEVSYE